MARPRRPGQLSGSPSEGTRASPNRGRGNFGRKLGVKGGGAAGARAGARESRTPRAPGRNLGGPGDRAEWGVRPASAPLPAERARGRPGPAPGPEPRPRPGARRRPRAAAGLTPAFHRRRRGRGGGARRGRGRALVAPATAALIRAWGSRAPPGAVGRREGGAGRAADPPPRGRAALTPALPARGLRVLREAPRSRAPGGHLHPGTPPPHTRAPHCSARLPAGARRPSSPKSPWPVPPCPSPPRALCSGEHLVPESGGGGDAASRGLLAAP